MNRRYKKALAGLATLAIIGCTPPLAVDTTTNTPAPVPTEVASTDHGSETVTRTIIVESTQEEQIINLYDVSSPSVVNVSATSYYTNPFFGSYPQEGTGSGFVYDDKGNILTNYHVIEGADELLITLSNGQSYEAELVGADAVNDLAVVHIDAGSNLPTALSIGDSDNLRVGQTVLAIGNPYGLDQTLTTGVISALGRVIQSPEDDRFIGEAIQTDAAINPGNSGGPLLNMTGEVIGVNSQIISSSSSSAGIGFAVSASTIKRVVPDLISKGVYDHPYLGASLLTLSESLTAALVQAGADIPVDSGLLVASVVDEGPAEQAGLLGGSKHININNYQFVVGGDIITHIEDREITDFEDLTLYLETETRVGQTVNLTILRDSKELIIPITLGKAPGQ